MPLDLTLILLVPALGMLGLALWQVRRKREPGSPGLIDWHYVLFPAILASLLLGVHAAGLMLGR